MKLYVDDVRGAAGAAGARGGWCLARNFYDATQSLIAVRSCESLSLDHYLGEGLGG